MYNYDMYALASQLTKLVVLSLQTGECIARIKEPILHLPTLELIGFLCNSEATGETVIMMTSDIRQYAHDCVLIDHEDELSNPADIVRYHPDGTLPTNPLRLLVVADTGRKIGIVTDYNLNLDTSLVQKIYVTKPSLKFWQSQQFIIDRTQIIDISGTQITVRDATIMNDALGKAPARQPSP